MAPGLVTVMNASALIDWAVASRTLDGEAESGDAYLVKPVGGGVLAAVVDGLGHGADAAAAARAALKVLERFPRDPLDELIKRCHAALVGTRGAVMSLAYVDGVAASVTWLGVGNVEGVIYARGAGVPRPRASLLASGGIVGSALPRLQSQVFPVIPGALLIFASDGIKTGFADSVTADVSPQQLANAILDRYGKTTDDALVLVVRYEGGAPPTRAQ